MVDGISWEFIRGNNEKRELATGEGGGRPLAAHRHRKKPVTRLSGGVVWFAILTFDECDELVDIGRNSWSFSYVLLQ
jgi:hypothetical protein